MPFSISVMYAPGSFFLKYDYYFFKSSLGSFWSPFVPGYSGLPGCLSVVQNVSFDGAKLRADASMDDIPIRHCSGSK